MDKYSINIKWSDEDECYVATIPEFPLLSALANTQEEAIAEAKIVLSMALESLQDDGIQPPEPRVVEDIAYSGQVRFRMPTYLHRKMAEEAKENNVSLNTYMVTLLSAKVSCKLSRSNPHILKLPCAGAIL